jgi:Tol biopolymer transport system component
MRILDAGSAGGSPPVWSPDGSRIVISLAEQSGAPLVFRTAEIRADGSGLKDLKLPPEDQVHDWSPDGRWLLTTSSRDAGGWRLYLVSLDGGERRRLSDRAGLYYPRFSPDGRRILCTASDGIWVMGLDGGNPRRVFEDGRSGASACWSPDGTRIAVVVNGRKGGEGQDAGRIELIGLDGSRGPVFRPAGGLTVDMPDWR